VLAGLVVLVLFVVVVGRSLARFYLDQLWFDSVGQSGTFWAVVQAKATMFVAGLVLFLVVAGINLFVADRVAPRRYPVGLHPVVERVQLAAGRRLGTYRSIVVVLCGIALALPATGHWQQWLLYRHRRSFPGGGDAQFGVDVGFYVFELPFVGFVVDWLFVAMIIVLLLTVVSHLLNGGVAFASPIPSMSQAMKGHLAVLVAVLAALKAADYWVRRYETTNARRGAVQGPTYSVVHATLPALLLLIVVALVVAGLYLSVLKTQSFRIPLVASGVWLALALGGGYLYPAIVQSLVVEPNQQAREASAIANNVEATRQAMGIGPNEVASVPIEFDSLSAADLVAAADGVPESGAAADGVGEVTGHDPLADLRLLNPDQARTQFVYYEAKRAGLTIDDLDVDRTELEPGRGLEQVLVGAIELDLANVANTSWQGRHLIYTHGCGIVQAPASRVLSNGRPIFSRVALDHDELYFSPSIDGWVVARTDADEQGCAGSDRYEGEAGIAMSSWFRRAAFALSFLDYNLLGSGSIHGDSQMLWVRNVRDRVAKLAPFLTFDGDPYPVEVDGRALWVVDGYTSTDRYPAAQAVGDDVALSDDSGIPRDANYVRNSVKAVVDAYDGTVRFYVVDELDPIVQAWASAFPELFTAFDDMPAGLRSHLRYPEDLFKVQTAMYSKYQLDPDDFFAREGAWSIAQAPRDDATAVVETTVTRPATETAGNEFATESASSRFVPYYTMFETPPTSGDPGGREFVLLRPFVPFSPDDSRTELQAYMTASSEYPNPRLTVHVVESSPLPDGPRVVASTISSDDSIAALRLQLNQARSGTNVEFGDLQLLPVGDGLLWARPFYVASRAADGGPTLKTYRYMVVVADGRAAYGMTIGQALNVLFPSLGDDFDVGEVRPTDEPPEPGLEPDELTGVGAGESGSSPGVSTPQRPALGDDATAVEVLERVQQLLDDANLVLQGDPPDLGVYQQLVDEASALLERFLAGSGTVPASSEPPG